MWESSRIPPRWLLRSAVEHRRPARLGSNSSGSACMPRSAIMVETPGMRGGTRGPINADYRHGLYVPPRSLDFSEREP